MILRYANNYAQRIVSDVYNDTELCPIIDRGCITSDTHHMFLLFAFGMQDLGYHATDNDLSPTGVQYFDIGRICHVSPEIATMISSGRVSR